MKRCVLITGASGGIGSAMAKAFAENGNAVVLAYHNNADNALQVCNEIISSSGQAVAVQVDVSKTEEVENMFAKAEEAFGGVDVLVNNAGVSTQRLFTDISEQEWDDMFAVNVKGVFLCSKRALPRMIAKKAGNIINVSSMWGQVGASCESHYSATKAAVIGLTKALAKEEAPSGVRVNCIAPGAIETEMMKSFSREDKEALCEEIPLGRLGSPEEVANLAVFLASDKASYVTGQVFSPNGGFVV